MQLNRASKYLIKTETAVSALADACARGGGSKLAAALELLRTVVLSWLIGNGDLHGKNLSIYCPDGVWQPTPAYDLLSTQPYTNWRDSMALNLYGRANRLSRKDFIDAGERLGVRERATARMLDSLLDAAERWPECCGDIGFDDRESDRLTAMLRTRMASDRRVYSSPRSVASTASTSLSGVDQEQTKRTADSARSGWCTT